MAWTRSKVGLERQHGYERDGGPATQIRPTYGLDLRSAGQPKHID